jgi:Sec-independent protein translocase protein TatA
MKRMIKIMLIFVFLLFAGKGFSQTAVQSGDTLRIRQQKMEQQKEQQKEQEKLRQGNQGQVQAANANASGQANGQAGKAVKQVKGSRPDMSKAKGARPPMIVRPSGSGVPKGVGKPGGAGRKGGR